jgi:excisionase family DNA binding protein
MAIHTSSNWLVERRVYTIAEVARLVGVSLPTIYRRVYSGEIKVISGFGRLTISAEELERFLGNQEIHTPQPRKQKREGK